MESLISVIIPVYNVEKYLSRCLESVINNTYKNLEIICIDDGSTDNSGRILEDLALVDNRIKIIKQVNGGVSSARNAGLDKAHGSYIAFIDSDDWIHPQYFEVLISASVNQNADIAICDRTKTNRETFEFENIDTVELKSRQLDLADIFSDHRLKSYIWGRIYKSSILDGCRFESGISFAEDALFNAVLLSQRQNAKAIFIPKCLYFYFDRSDSLVYSPDRSIHLQKLSNKYLEYATEATTDWARRTFAIEAIKRGLSARYDYSFLDDKKTKIEECSITIKNAIRTLSTHDISIIERFKYCALWKSPGLYRLFRIIDDPTMIRWEKQQRKSRSSRL